MTKVWIEIRFDNCQDYNANIKLKGIELAELKINVAPFIHNLERLQEAINKMVQNSEKETEQ
jgi:hypothetical protein